MVKKIGQMAGGDRGFTLVEVLVSISVIMVVMTAVLSGVSFSIKNTRFAAESANATRYAQEAVEWIRGLRNQEGWGPFMEVLDEEPADPVVYCLAGLPAGLQAFKDNLNHRGSGCGTNEVISGTNLVREMRLDISPGGDQVDVEVQVNWYEGNDLKTKVVETKLYQWDK